MLRDGSIDTNDNTWTGDGRRHTWRDIDRELRALAKRRGRLDAEEARLLCSVARIEVWRELGKASLLEYLEEVLGYGPRAASERVRVAIALDELPDLAEALASGELSYSAIREITRVAVPATQREWRDDARGKNLRQIEQMVSERKKGDKPTDPPSPELRPRVVRFEVRPATFALLRQVQQVLADERGAMLDDDALVAAMCDAVLAGGGEDNTRAKFQVLTVTCPSCKHAAQEGAGVRVAVGPADRDRAECDAQRVGTDGARTTQDVTPKKRQAIFRRDGGKCCVPGCRASRYLEIHHVVPQAAGGSHELDNLTLLCEGHHHALHDGKLTIIGKAPELVVQWKHHATPSKTHVGNPSRYELVTLATEAKQALVQSGFTKPVARAAVDKALDQLGPSVTLEELIRAALRST
jgi:hypothetical protein